MLALSQAELLAAAELGRDQDPLGQALALWHVASTHAIHDLELRPIGHRDRALLDSRIATFGPMAESYVECTECAEGLEFELDLRQFLLESDGHDLTLHYQGTDVAFRLPTTADLRAVQTSADPRASLVARCVERPEGLDIDHNDASFQASVEAAMQAADPQADIEIKLTCAACSNTWMVRFDIGAFYWREVQVAAQRTLREVHTIARAYGWSESEILDLHPDRRRRYIEMIAG